jgi:uncharacterized protein
MDPVLLAIIGVLAGLMGSMVGLGGGILIVPVLSLFMGVPIKEAIAASVVAVIATSTTGAVSYVRDEVSNIRLGMTLETATTIGAVLGGLTATMLKAQVLQAIFGVFLILMAAYLFLKGRQKNAYVPTDDPGLLGGRYYDPYLKQYVGYRVRRLPVGLAASFVAGNISGLLGIGGGPIKVPTMTIAMGVPMKAAAATSNFMIGVTACASACIYYTRGLVNPLVAVPVALGVTAGAYVGSRLAPKVSGTKLAAALAVILLLLAVQMALAVLGFKVR